MTPSEYLQAARYAFSQDETNRGRALCESLVKEFPDSSEAEDAKSLLSHSERIPTIPEKSSGPETQRSVEFPKTMDVRVVDFDMSFVSMVKVFVKAALAVIPAAIILTIIGFVMIAMFSAFV